MACRVAASRELARARKMGVELRSGRRFLLAERLMLHPMSREGTSAQWTRRSPCARSTGASRTTSGCRAGRRVRDQPARQTLVPIEPGRRVRAPEQQAAREPARERLRRGIEQGGAKFDRDERYDERCGIGRNDACVRRR